MKNNFVVVILLFLSITGLGFSAPQKNATISEIARVSQNQFPKDPLEGLSKSCQTALITIITSQEFLQCIPAIALPFLTDPSLIASLISDPKTGLKRLQPDLINLSNDVCALPKCSDKGIADAIKTIQTGCTPDDMKTQLMKIVFPVVVFYSPARDSICFKDAENPSHFCLVEDDITTLTNLPKPPSKLLGNDFLDSIIAADPTAICTTCNKAIYNTFGNFINSTDLVKQILAVEDKIILDIIEVWLAIKCNIEFEDGMVPDPSKPPPPKK